jgi:hypothetical protein
VNQAQYAKNPKRITASVSVSAMRPGVVILGFLLGSAGAITFSLGGVALIYFLLGSEYPRLATEIGALLVHLGIFMALTVVAALSFYAEIKAAVWRRASSVGLVAMLLLVVAFYWPD